jgi:hypothetical protein
LVIPLRSNRDLFLNLMKRIFWIICFVFFAARVAFDPFKAPVHTDPVGKASGYICGAFILVLGWVVLRKPAVDDRPGW